MPVLRRIPLHNIASLAISSDISTAHLANRAKERPRYPSSAQHSITGHLSDTAPLHILPTEPRKVLELPFLGWFVLGQFSHALYYMYCSDLFPKVS